MKDRRGFLKWSMLGLAGYSLSACGSEESVDKVAKAATTVGQNGPIVISTWDFGQGANKSAWEVLSSGGYALDAVEAGVKVAEADASNTSVGYGGLPDRNGNITLDACIMNENGRCGSVAYLQNIKHPISVARKVMEETPHVMLVGDGALAFAKSQGFTEEDLHTPASKEKFAEWSRDQVYKTEVNRENHDTIGMLAIDPNGRISGACTTSGMAFKLPGRVGDSPLIGAGLYVDSEVGAAVATGVGEEIIRVSGASMIVELMRQGASPNQACREMVNRVKKRNSDVTDLQVCFIALSIDGSYSGYAMHPGFEYAVKTGTTDQVIKSDSLLG